MIEWIAANNDYVVTVEENVIAGGAGSAVAEALAARGIVVPLLHLGLPDAFIEHGDPAQLLASCGLDATGIAASIMARFGALRADAERTPESARIFNLAKPAA